MGGHETMTSINDPEQGKLPNGTLSKPQLEIGNVPRSEYHERFVKGNLQHRPWLEILHQFMNPYAKGFAVSLKRRMLHFDIKVIHISKDGSVESPITCLSPTKFHDAISKEQEPEARSGTLIIVKDISRAVIDSLGMEYGLEPEFFASHLEGTEAYGMGPWVSPTVRPTARAPNLLPDYLRKGPFYTAQYRRPYHLKGAQEEVLRLRCSVTNTARGAHVLHANSPDIFVCEKISVYRKAGSNIGVILTDQLLSKALSSSYIHSPVTFLDDDPATLGTDGRSQQVSSRREFIVWLQRLAPAERRDLFRSQEPLALRPTLKIVERTSSMFLVHARYLMTRVLNRFCDETFPNSIPFFLSLSRALNRHILHHQKILLHALRVAALRGGGGSIAEQIEDFGFLVEDMDRARKALEEEVRFLASTVSIREGRIVGWVSKFAALFLPVSLLATILTISDPGYVRWAVLGGLSVPFVLISVFFMFFWKPPHLDSLIY